jgi:hypothetical protein
MMMMTTKYIQSSKTTFSSKSFKNQTASQKPSFSPFQQIPLLKLKSHGGLKLENKILKGVRRYKISYT